MKVSVRDLIEASTLFQKPPTREKKVKGEMTLRQYMKLSKEIEEFNEWKKSKEPKKEEKKPEGLTLPQKTILWTISGLVLGPAYLLFLSRLLKSLGTP